MSKIVAISDQIVSIGLEYLRLFHHCRAFHCNV